MTPPEIIPAETIQADEHPMHDAFPIRWAIPLAFGLAIILTLVGASA